MNILDHFIVSRGLLCGKAGLKIRPDTVIASVSPANQAAAFVRISCSVHNCLFPGATAQDPHAHCWSAHLFVGLRPGRPEPPSSESPEKRVRTLGLNLPGCDRHAPTQPSVAGTPADKGDGTLTWGTSFPTRDKVSTKPDQVQDFHHAGGDPSRCPGPTSRSGCPFW